MRFGSVCSGIEAASVAWEPLGWKAAWLAEIEPFPSAVLAHHYPEVPNLGDMTTLPTRILLGEVEAPDVFCGGTPCQAFSVAGLRRSLDDARGNLSLIFCEIADAIDSVRRSAGLAASIVFWENVPGVLSTKDNAFGCFLAGLAGEDDPLVPPGGKWTDAGVVHGPQRTVAWRVLDAQYFGLVQRRKRVFVVASARDGFNPAAVLLEYDGVRRDSPPSRETGQSPAPTIAGCANGGGANGPGRDVDSCESLQLVRHRWPAECAGTLDASFGKKWGLEDQHINSGAPLFVPGPTHSLRGEGFDASEDGTGRGTPLVPVAFHPTQDPISSEDGTTHAMGCGSKGGAATVAVAQPVELVAALTASGRGVERTGESRGQDPLVLATAMQVRRLTPRECERLQGFPDDYTAIPWRGKSESPDGPRYKALGNSWAVPVVRWIGKRIARQC